MDDELIQKQNQNKKESLLQRCQRILAEWIPGYIDKLKNSLEEDLLIAKVIVHAFALLCFQTLGSYAIELQLSGADLCFYLRMNILLIFQSYCFRLLLKCSSLQQFNQSFSLDFFMVFCLLGYTSHRQNPQSSQQTELLGLLLFGFVGTILTAIGCTLKKRELFPKASLMPKLVWIFSILTLVTLVRLYPIAFQFEENSYALISFVIVSEFCGCICATAELSIKWRTYLWKKNKISFIYSQTHYSELTKLMIVSLYQYSSAFSVALMILATLLQSSVCWWIKVKLKPFIILLKYAKCIEYIGFALKRRANQCIPTNTSHRYDNVRMKTIRQRHHFQNELCCWCNQRPADIANITCQHICICHACFDLKKRKLLKRPIIGMICPICEGSMFIVVKLKVKSSSHVIRQILRKDRQNFLVYEGYNFEFKTILDGNEE